MARRGWMRAIAILGGVAALGWLALSIVVQMESAYVRQSLGGRGPQRGIVLYHPSRDAGFSDQLAVATAEGLRDAGYAVQSATLTGRTPAVWDSFGVVAIVSNTYYGSPDQPTLRYLARARLEGKPAFGLMAGAGTTGRAERLLREALRKSGADVLATRSFWIWRPNDESRTRESNWRVALERARRYAAEQGNAALAR